MQLTLNFEAGLFGSYPTCRDLIAARVHQQTEIDEHGKIVKLYQMTIAGRMDYSPSDLTRKLAQAPDDSRRFTLDDLEKFVQITGDTQPILYLVEKYLCDAGDEEIEELERALSQKKAMRAAKQVPASNSRGRK